MSDSGSPALDKGPRRRDPATRKDLRTAIKLHQSGQLAAALPLYEKVLSLAPESDEALHRFCLLHHQQNNHLVAIEMIKQAVTLRPAVFVYHANLGEVYRALGAFEEAATCYRAALQLWPDYPEAHCNLGAALQALGRAAEAVQALHLALKLRPNFAVAHNNLGMALRDLGDWDTALEHFRRATELEPAFAPAWTNLGLLLLEKGQTEDALPHCQTAVRLEPTSAVLHDNLGNVFRALDRLVDATKAYLDAVRLNPELATANAHLGLVLQRQGRLGNALRWLKKAVELDADNVTYSEWLAELYDELDEPSESITFWERVLLQHPKRPAVHLALGRALQEIGRLAEAREHFLVADELQPNAPSPRVSLGWLHEQLGEMAEAEAAYQEAIQRLPDFALPHGRLATLLRGKLPETDLTAIENLLSNEKPLSGHKARLLFGLAHVLDARAEYKRSAARLEQANAITLELTRGRREYDPTEHKRFVDGLIHVFDHDFFTRLAGVGSNSRRPVFIFGLPRSGTTLIEQVLASHSQIHGAGELRLARQMFESIASLVGRPGTFRDCVPLVDPGVVGRLAEKHLDCLAAIDGERALRIVDKMPDNYQYLGLLAVLFPRAVFIHCRREVRDVAVSCWMTDFNTIRWANSYLHIAHRFSQYVRLMNHWRKALPVPITEVDYEETVADLESVSRQLLSACGLDWESGCLEFHRTQRPVRTASVTQVRQPVYHQSVARWKNYEPMLAEFFATLPQVVRS